MGEPLGWVDVEQDGDVRICRVHGEVDISNVEDVQKLLEGGTDERARLHIADLSETAYFDSAGIRALFSLASRLRSRQQGLRIVAPSGGIVRRVLEMADLPSVVPIFDTLDAARTGPVPGP